MEQSAKIKIDFLNIDGGMTQSNVLMQMQSDILQKKLVKPSITDATCLGTALMAALGAGIFKTEEDILKILSTECEFQPDLSLKSASE